MTASAKSPDPIVIARQARKLAERALDRAEEAIAEGRSKRTDMALRIDALERRLDEGHVSIMKELAEIRVLLSDIVKMLVNQMGAKAP